MYYNRVHIKLIETLKINHYNGFKAIPINYGAKKPIIVDLDVEIQVNLLSKTPFHKTIITKFVIRLRKRSPHNL